MQSYSCRPYTVTAVPRPQAPTAVDVKTIEKTSKMAGNDPFKKCLEAFTWIQQAFPSIELKATFPKSPTFLSNSQPRCLLVNLI